MASQGDPIARDKAREEIRALRRSNRSDYPGHLILTSIKDFAMSQNGRPATDKGAQHQRANLLKIAQTNLRAFHLNEQRYKLMNTNAAANVASFYYWFPTAADIMSMTSDDTYEDNLLVLRHCKLAVDRKRTIYDEYDAGITVNQHTLMRMIERGAAVDFPLDVLNRQFATWYPLATAILVCQAWRQEGNQALIPIADGAILTRTTFAHHSIDPLGVNLGRRRAIGDRQGFRMANAPLVPMIDHKLDDKEGTPLLHMSTYVARLQLSSDQWWVYTQLSKLRDDFKDILALHPFIIHSTQFLSPLGPFKDQLVDFASRIGKILDSQQWQRACRDV